MVLAQKRPPSSIMNIASPNTADASAQRQASEVLIKRIEQLESKQTLLEQQIASQQTNTLFNYFASNKKTEIDENGEVSMPLVGRIKADGLSSR